MSGVVVGVGTAANSIPAVRWGCDEAAVRGVIPDLVHAWNEPIDLSLPLGPECLPEVHWPVTASAVRGDVRSALLGRHPDLLVLGAHIGSRRLSPIARGCIQQSECPVVVVSQISKPQANRVVVGVNGNRASHAALGWAAREARLRSAALVVAYAWQVHPVSAHDVVNPARAVPGQQPQALDRLRGWVDGFLEPSPVELHAVHGPPLEALLDLSADADLVVVGHSTRSRFERILSGALASDLTSLASCPVVVVPRPRERWSAKDAGMAE